MAGAQDDNRQHFKKQSNRQDYNSNAKRKNSFAGSNKNLHNTTLPPASGTVTTSPTTPTSTSSSHTLVTGPGPALPSLKPAPEHVPVNNFNAQEVSNYLNNTWKETLDRYHDNNLPETEKPELYRSEMAWGGGGTGLVWGKGGHLMANGKDFFAELRKSTLTQASNAQPATAK